MKKALLALILMLCLCPVALSEESNAPTFGVVERHNASLTQKATIEQLDVSYVRQDNLIPKAGDTVSWTVYAVGGDGVYSYEYTLCSVTNEGLSYYTASADSLPLTRENTCSFTIQNEGMYLLSICIQDENENTIQYRTMPFTVYDTLDENDADTVYGKVKQIVKQCLEEVGDDQYGIALWLHDYLTENANYDMSLSYYYADGVLLHGSGVCQSYALAYEMLLREAGIESIIVTGIANDDNHAWNMVRIGGKWYQVDCTWDDPGTGGQENHAYFCVTDAVMAKDHSWADDWKYLPECTDDSLMVDETYGALHFSTAKEIEAILADAIANKQQYVLLYNDPDNSDWINLLNNALEKADIGFTYYGTGNLLCVYLEYGIWQQVNSLEDAYALLDDATAHRMNHVHIVISSDCGSSTEIKHALDDYIENIATVTYFSDTTSKNTQYPEYYVDADIYLGYDSVQSARHIVALQLSRSVIVCKAGETRQLQARYPGYSYDPQTNNWEIAKDSSFILKWSSSDETVVTVNQNGDVTAVGSGTATVSVSCAGQSASCLFVVSVKELVLPEDTITVEEDAFEGCSDITVLRCNEKLREIKANAFSGCEKLLLIILGSDDVVISDDAFSGCGEIMILNANGTLRK